MVKFIDYLNKCLQNDEDYTSETIVKIGDYEI